MYTIDIKRTFVIHGEGYRKRRERVGQGIYTNDLIGVIVTKSEKKNNGIIGSDRYGVERERWHMNHCTQVQGCNEIRRR